MNWLDPILNKKERLVVGLMSGTSMDGIDAALVRIKGHGLETRLEVIKFICIPYESSLLKRLEDVISNGSTRQISETNFLVGEAFAEAVLAVIKEAGFSTDEVDLIGSHGQTIFHDPPSAKNGVASTLQIGELDVIAERTGVTTIGDFRPRDIAAGGEGAPLVPYVDFILFRRKGKVSIAQNIGGIANSTVITERIDDIIAFDNGPGNLLMNSVISIASGGRNKYDEDGKVASLGVVKKDLLKKLLSDPYFNRLPPKSTGAEIFGNARAKGVYASVKKRGITLHDLMATLLALTVESIALSYEEFIIPKWSVEEVILSGGGARNPVLVDSLKSRLGSLKFSTTDSYGIPIDAKEAISFAILANELISGYFTNIPSVTGARVKAPLGKIVLGHRLK